MSTMSTFWFCCGLMSALAVVAIAMPIGRRLLPAAPVRARFAFAAVALIVSAAAVGLYRLWGDPAALTTPAVATAPGNSPHEKTAGAGAARVGTIEEAADKLSQRLNDNGGSPADWNLLAQSYDYLDRPQDAAEARRRADSAPAAAVPGRTRDAAPPARVMDPKVAELVAKAEKERAARQYGKAAALYRQATLAGSLNADAWANYADAAASASGGRLQGEPLQFVDRALLLDPEHTKALWLKASALHDAAQYRQALDVWQHLQRSLAPESPDAKIIAQNIQEDQQLAGGMAVPDAIGSASISGTVDLSAALRDKARAGATLFIFAQSVDSPGPPLAVTRLSVAQWPVTFTLSDAQAIVPDRRLSKFGAVKVEARVSSNGEPVARRGDLQGDSAPLDAHAERPVHIVIDRIIG